MGDSHHHDLLVKDALDRLATQIRHLAERNDAPRTAIAEGKTMTKFIAEKIAQVNELLLKRLDVLMRQFQKDEPGFFSDYVPGRRVA